MKGIFLKKYKEDNFTNGVKKPIISSHTHLKLVIIEESNIMLRLTAPEK